MAATGTIHPLGLETKWFFTYEWDTEFYGLYRDFIRTAKKVVADAGMDAIPEEYFEPAILVEVLFDNLRGHKELEAHNADLILDEFGHDVGNALNQLFYEFIGKKVYPIGLQDIARELPEGAFLMEMVMSREDEAFYYMFDDN